jgi:hypothetical protein
METRGVVSLAFRVAGVAAVIGLLIATGRTAVSEDPQPQDDLEHYTLDYPVAEQFCPPVRSTFFEVEQTMMMVGGKRFASSRTEVTACP